MKKYYVLILGVCMMLSSLGLGDIHALEEKQNQELLTKDIYWNPEGEENVDFVGEQPQSAIKEVERVLKVVEQWQEKGMEVTIHAMSPMEISKETILNFKNAIVKPYQDNEEGIFRVLAKNLTLENITIAGESTAIELLEGELRIGSHVKIEGSIGLRYLKTMKTLPKIFVKEGLEEKYQLDILSDERKEKSYSLISTEIVDIDTYFTIKNIEYEILKEGNELCVSRLEKEEIKEEGKDEVKKQANEETEKETPTYYSSETKNRVYWNPTTKDIISPEDDQIIISAGSDLNDGSRSDIPVLTWNKAYDLAAGGTIVIMTSLALGSEDAISAGFPDKAISIDGRGVTIEQWDGAPEDVFVISEGTTLTLKNINIKAASGYEESTSIRIVKGVLEIDENVAIEGQIQTELSAFSDENLSPIVVLKTLPIETKYVVYYSDIYNNLFNQAGNVVAPMPSWKGLHENFILSTKNAEEGWALRYQPGDEVDDPSADKDKLDKNILELFKPYELDGVFIDGIKGKDTNNGIDCSRPVKTFARAKEILKNKASGKGNIYVCNTVQSTKDEVWSLSEDEGFDANNKVKPCPNYYKHPATKCLMSINDGHTVETKQLNIDGFTDRLDESISNKDTSHSIENNIIIQSGGTYIMSEGTRNHSSNIAIIAKGTSSTKATAILNNGFINSLKTNINGNKAVITVDGLIMNQNIDCHAELKDSVFNLNSGKMANAKYYSIQADNTVINMNDGEILENGTSRTKEDTWNSGALVLLNGSTLTMTGGKITDNKGSLSPILAKSSTLVISGGEISNNYSFQSGGAIALRDNSTLTLNGGLIDSNNAEKQGGAFALSEGSMLTLNGGIISKNSANGSGGAIYLKDASSMILNDGEISNNTTKDAGGAIALSDTCSMTLTNGTISNNKAENSGGAIFAPTDSKVTLSSGTIDANQTLAGDGGGLAILDNATLKITAQVNITNNRATTYGGGIYLLSSTVATLDGLHINSNHSSVAGGGIYSTQALQLNNIECMSNTVSNSEAIVTTGGGVFCEENITINTCNIVKNSAQEGAGIYAKKALTASSSTFDENNGVSGIGMYVVGELALDTVNVSRNMSLSITKNTYGVGIYVKSDANIKNSIIDGNDINKGALRPAYGIGIYAAGNSGKKLQISNTTITNNSSNYVYANGGGIYSSQNTVLTSCTVEGNKGNNGAGIMKADGTTRLLLDDTIITNNSAETGGGVHLSSSSLTMQNNSNIINNHANSGGGVYVNICKQLTGINVNDNQSRNAGGGIYFYSTGSTADYASMQNYTITGNSAVLGGGIYVKDSRIKFYSGDIINNDANDGASVYTQDGDTIFYQGKIETSTFRENGIFINGKLSIKPQDMSIKSGVYIHNVSYPLQLIGDATAESKKLPIHLSSDFKNGSIVVTYSSPITDVSMYSDYFKGGKIPEKTILAGYKKNVILISEGVYLDGTSGDDSNRGTSPSDAVKTFERSEQLLREYINNAKNDGDSTTYFSPHIYICGQVNIRSNTSWQLDADEEAFQQPEDTKNQKPEIRRFLQYRGTLVDVATNINFNLNKININGIGEGMNSSEGVIGPIINASNNAKIFVNEKAEITNNYTDNVILNNADIVVQGNGVGGKIGRTASSPYSVKATNNSTITLQEKARITDRAIHISDNTSLLMQNESTVKNTYIIMEGNNPNVVMKNTAAIDRPSSTASNVDYAILMSNSSNGSILMQDDSVINGGSNYKKGIKINGSNHNRITMQGNSSIENFLYGISMRKDELAKVTIMMENNASITKCANGIDTISGVKSGVIPKQKTILLTLKDEASISEVSENGCNFDNSLTTDSIITLEGNSFIRGMKNSALNHSGIVMSDRGTYLLKDRAQISDFYNGMYVYDSVSYAKIYMSESSKIFNNLNVGVFSAAVLTMNNNASIETNGNSGVRQSRNIYMFDDTRISNNSSDGVMSFGKLEMSGNSHISMNKARGIYGGSNVLMKDSAGIFSNNGDGTESVQEATMSGNSHISDNNGNGVSCSKQLTMSDQSSIYNNASNGVYSINPITMALTNNSRIYQNGFSGFDVNNTSGNSVNVSLDNQSSIDSNGSKGISIINSKGTTSVVDIIGESSIYGNQDRGLYVDARTTTISIGGSSKIINNYKKDTDNAYGESVYANAKVNLHGGALVDDEIYMAHPKRNITLTGAVSEGNQFIVGYPSTYMGVALVSPDKTNVSDATLYYDQFVTKNIPRDYGILKSGVDIVVQKEGDVFIAGDGTPTDELCVGDDRNSGHSRYFPVRTFKRAKEVLKTMDAGANLIVCNFTVEVKAGDENWEFDEGGTVSNGVDTWQPTVMRYGAVSPMIAANAYSSLTVQNMKFGDSNVGKIFLVSSNRSLELLDGTIFANLKGESLVRAENDTTNIKISGATIEKNIFSNLVDIASSNNTITVENSNINNNVNASIYVNKDENTTSNMTLSKNMYTKNKGNGFVKDGKSIKQLDNMYTTTIKDNQFIDNLCDSSLLDVSHGNTSNRIVKRILTLTGNTLTGNTSENYDLIRGCGNQAIVANNTISNNVTNNKKILFLNMNNVSILKTTIENNTNSFAIDIDGAGSTTASVSIDDCNINNNHQGVNILNIKSNSIRNTDIYKHISEGLYLNGASVALEKVNIFDNTGSGIYASNSSINGKETTIRNNQSINGSGLNIYAGVPVTISGLDICDNTATSNGGGIFVNYSTENLDVKNNNIKNNKASNGGGIYCYMVSNIKNKMKISNVNLDGNIATANGGGIHSSGSIVTNLENSTFSNNNALAGGAIYLKGGTLSTTGTNMIQNQADEGGAIYADSTTLATTSTSMTKNQAAGRGGAVYITRGSHSFGSGTISENMAGDSGGAIYAHNINYTRVTNANILDNRANVKGSAIYYCSDGLSKGRFEISGGVIDRNKVNIKNMDQRFERSAIYVDGPDFQISGGGATINDRIFLSSRAYKITMTGSIYQKNRTYLVDLDNSFGKGDVVVQPDNSVITNAAQYHKYFYVDYPGYVLEKSTPNLSLKQCIFIDGIHGDNANHGSRPSDAVKTFERAKEIGGGGDYIIYASGPIYVNGVKEWQLPSSSWISRYTGFKITGESFPRYDGDIITIGEDEKLTLSNCAVFGRREIDATGAVGSLVRVKNKGTFVMNDNTSLSRNEALENGGAIYIEDGAKTTITGGSVEATTAKKGSAIYQNGSLYLEKSPKIIGDVYLCGNGQLEETSKYIYAAKDYKLANKKLSITIENPYNFRKVIEYPNTFVANQDNIDVYTLDDSIKANYEFKVRKDETNVLELYNRDAIYLDGTGVYGDDAHDGKTPKGSVKTLKKAYELLANIGKGGTIIIVGTVTIDKEIQLTNSKNELGLSGAYKDYETTIEAGNYVTFQRYAKPMKWELLEKKDLYDVENCTAALFDVKDTFKLDNIIIDGHSKETLGSVEYTANGVEAKAPIITVSPTGEVYTTIGTTFTNNANVGKDSCGGAVSIDGGKADLEGTDILNTKASKGSAIYQNGELWLSRQPVIEGSIYLAGTGTKNNPTSSKYIHIKTVGFMPQSKKLTIELEDTYESRIVAKYPEGTENSIRDFDIQIYDLSQEVRDVFYLDKRVGSGHILELKLRRGIYIDGINGDDNDTGLTPLASVKTLEKAYELVKKYRGAVIFVVDTVIIDKEIEISQHKYVSDKTIDLQEDNTKIYRYARPDDYMTLAGFNRESNKNTLFEIRDTGVLTIDDLEIDGHKSPRTGDNIINTQQVSGNTEAKSPLLKTLEGGMLHIINSASLQNNDNSEGDGGALVNYGNTNYSDAIIQGNIAKRGSAVYQMGEMTFVSGSQGVKNQEIYLGSILTDDKVLHIQEQIVGEFSFSINMDRAMRSRNVVVFDNELSFDANVVNEKDHFVCGDTVPKNLGLYESTNDAETNILELYDPIDAVIKNVWQDVEDFDKIRPESILVDLCQEGKVIATVELNEANNWEMEVERLYKYIEPKYIEEVTYEVRQTAEIEGYQTTYNQEELTITNTHVPVRGITYFGNDQTSGTVPVDNTKYKYGSTIEVMDNSGKDKLEKAGYIFIGWNTKADGTGTHYDIDDTIIIDEDKELYAMWLLLTKTSKEEIKTDILRPGEKLTYTIEYKMPEDAKEIVISDLLSENVEFVSAKQEVKYEEEARQLTWKIEDVKKDETYSITFEVIVKDTKIGEVIKNVANIQIGDKVYQSNATKDKVGEYYRIRYDLNQGQSGTLLEDKKKYITGEAGVVLGDKETLTREGYFFIGWSTSKAGKDLYQPQESIKIEEDITMYAMWLQLTKISDAKDSKVKKDDEITYTLQLDIASQMSKVKIVDKLDSAVEFISGSKGVRYDPKNHSIEWEKTEENEKMIEIVITVKVNTKEVGKQIRNQAKIFVGKEEFVSNEVVDTVKEGYQIFYHDGDIEATDGKYYDATEDVRLLGEEVLNKEKDGKQFGGWKEIEGEKIYQKEERITFKGKDIHMYASWYKNSGTNIAPNSGDTITNMYLWINTLIVTTIIGGCVVRCRKKEYEK